MGWELILPGGAPKQNDNAGKRRLFEHTVRRALTQDDGKRLRQAAETLLDLAANGERWAVECLRDTLDGRPKQSVDIDVTNRSVVDLDDTSLAGLVAASRSSGTAGPQDGPQEPAGLH